MTQRFRLAVAQTPVLPGVAARVDWLQEKVPKIAEQGADLVLVPELFSCGYHIGAALPDHAQPRDGALYHTLRDLARSCQVALNCGYVETCGAQLYNSAMCIGASGDLIGHHRKLAIPPGFERSYFAKGEGCQVFDYAGLRIATLICYDAEFPETIRHAAEQGAQLVLVPTALGADWEWVARQMIPTRAYENGVYLAYANHAGTENGMTYLGQSVIAAPNGSEAARAGADPTVLYADLLPDLIRQAQTRLPYLIDRQTLSL